MCTIMLYPESLGAQMRSRTETRRQVDDLMQYDRERAAGHHPFPPAFDPESRRELRRRIDELKAQVAEIVKEVMSDNSNRRVTVLSDSDLKKIKSPKTKTETPKTE